MRRRMIRQRTTGQLGTDGHNEGEVVAIGCTGISRRSQDLIRTQGNREEARGKTEVGKVAGYRFVVNDARVGGREPPRYQPSHRQPVGRGCKL
jgi:hypothetical protein